MERAQKIQQRNFRVEFWDKENGKFYDNRKGNNRKDFSAKVSRSRKRSKFKKLSKREVPLSKVKTNIVNLQFFKSPSSL